MSKRIFQLKQVKLSIRQRKPLVISIDAEGSVLPNEGVNGRLSPFVYGKPPADGIYEFEFVAERLPAAGAERLQTIVAETYEWRDIPENLSGIKIYAEVNSMIRMRNNLHH